MRSVVFVVAHDSQFKWAASVAGTFSDNGWEVRYFAPEEHAQISEAQIRDVGLDPANVSFGPTASYLSYLAKQDAVVFPTPGGITERMLYQMRDLASVHPIRRRPVLVTAYVGLVIDNPVGGFLHRAPADIVCVNSQHDLNIFRNACKELQISEENLLLSGLAIVPDAIKPQSTRPIRKVIYADQLAIPNTIAYRHYIYKKLIEYAVAHPDRQVIVKPRHRPDEASFHESEYPPERFFERIFLPSNIFIDYTPLKALLPCMDLLLTVSSTAALEGIAEGARVAILSDIGIREVHGNQIFIGSSLVRSFAQIINDDIGIPNPEWISQFQQPGVNSSQTIYEAVVDKCEQRDKDDLPLMESAYFSARRSLLLDIYGFHRKSPAGRVRRDSRGGGLAEARNRLAAGDWSGALDVSASALSKSPAATKHMRIAAAALSKLGRIEEATRYLKRARKLRPDDLRLRWHHRWLKKRLWLSRVLGHS